MPYGVRYFDGTWCVVSETTGETIAVRESRDEALAALVVVYGVEPVLAAMDWGEQRIVASAATRWRARYQLGGTKRALLAAARLADPSPLSAEDVAWLDEVSRTEPAHRHLSRDLAGRVWPRTAAVQRTRLRRLSRELAVIDQKLGDRLYSGAVLAMRDALRRAGVKAQVRAKNRGKTATLGALTPTVLAAIGAAPDELLDRAFVSFQAEAEDWIHAADRKRARAIADAYDVDPDDLEDDPRADHRAEQAAVLLALLLLRRARRALSDQALVADVQLAVPFVEVRTALRVRDGWQVIHDIRQGPNLTPQADAGMTLIPPEHGTGAIDELLGKVAPQSNFVRGFEWVHGFFGEPQTPFHGHLAVDGAQYDDASRADVLAADPSEWPFVAVYSTDDHDDCTCYEVITYEPDEG